MRAPRRQMPLKMHQVINGPLRKAPRKVHTLTNKQTNKQVPREILYLHTYRIASSETVKD